MIFVPNLVANARAFFPLVSAFEIKKNKQEEYLRPKRISSEETVSFFSEYTEECCSSPFEFDAFTFVSATVRLE